AADDLALPVEVDELLLDDTVGAHEAVQVSLLFAGQFQGFLRACEFIRAATLPRPGGALIIGAWRRLQSRSSSRRSVWTRFGRSVSARSRRRPTRRVSKSSSPRRSLGEPTGSASRCAG